MTSLIRDRTQQVLTKTVELCRFRQTPNDLGVESEVTNFTGECQSNER